MINFRCYCFLFILSLFSMGLISSEQKSNESFYQSDSADNKENKFSHFLDIVKLSKEIREEESKCNLKLDMIKAEIDKWVKIGHDLDEGDDHIGITLNQDDGERIEFIEKNEKSQKEELNKEELKKFFVQALIKDLSFLDDPKLSLKTLVKDMELLADLVVMIYSERYHQRNDKKLLSSIGIGSSGYSLGLATIIGIIVIPLESKVSMLLAGLIPSIFSAALTTAIGGYLYLSDSWLRPNIFIGSKSEKEERLEKILEVELLLRLVMNSKGSIDGKYLLILEDFLKILNDNSLNKIELK